MLRFLNFLAYITIYWHSSGTLWTLFFKPWFMNNKQEVCPTEAWKYHFINSWNSSPMYGWFCNVYIIFLSFDTSHWPAIWHSTIGGGGGGVNLIHLSSSNMTSACNHAKTRNYGKMSWPISPKLIMQ